MNNIFKHCNIRALTLLLFIVTGCSKKSDEAVLIDGKTQLIVSANLQSNTTAQTIVNKSSANNSLATLNEIIALPGGLEMFAELTPVDAHKNSSSTTVQNKENRAVTTTNELSSGIYYKLVIFDNMGNYVQERNYRYQYENTEEPLYLEVGSTYTFIAYSINNTNLASLPSLDGPANNEDKTLSNCSVQGVYNQDLLYFKHNLLISATTKNYLSIVFKHTFNNIETTVIATNTEYEITNIDANLVKSHPYVNINFSTSAVTPSGGASSPDYEFVINPLNNTEATSENSVININPGESILKINNLTIGPLTINNITPFSNVTLTPGTNYKLTLTIMPIDETLDHGLQKAVRINGQIWMRHNLRDNNIYSLNPDVLGPAIQGDYYQWGEPLSYASGTAQNADKNSFTNFKNNAPQNTSFFARWNATAAPYKGNDDPCPENYRLPTETELKKLIEDTTYEFIGTRATNNSTTTNYQYALRLTSKRRKSVIMTIPAQGYGGIAGNEGSVNTYGFGTFISRGYEIYLKSRSYVYVTSKPATNNSNIQLIVFKYQLLQAFNMASKPSIYTGPGGGQTSAFANGHPIRCIATNPNRSSTVINDRTVDKENGNATF